MMKLLSFGDWFLDWYEVYKKAHFIDKTQKLVETIYRLHIPETLKKTPLTALKTFDIDKALATLPPSRTAKLTRDLVCASLSKAYKLELVKKDFSKLIEPIRYKVKNGTALSSFELANFFRVLVGHKLEKLFYFYLMTGCRRHEALTLLWSDIDFQNKTVLIRGTKTALSLRVVPLTDELAELLRSVPRDNVRVFPFNDDYITKTFKRFCPAHHLHDLRHTFATICAENNLHPTATQRLLGHSQINTTMRIYTHVQSEFISKEVKKLDFAKILTNKKSE